MSLPLGGGGSNCLCQYYPHRIPITALSTNPYRSLLCSQLVHLSDKIVFANVNILTIFFEERKCGSDHKIQALVACKYLFESQIVMLENVRCPSFLHFNKGVGAMPRLGRTVPIYKTISYGRIGLARVYRNLGIESGPHHMYRTPLLMQ